MQIRFFLVKRKNEKNSLRIQRNMFIYLRIRCSGVCGEMWRERGPLLSSNGFFPIKTPSTIITSDSDLKRLINIIDGFVLIVHIYEADQVKILKEIPQGPSPPPLFNTKNINGKDVEIKYFLHPYKEWKSINPKLQLCDFFLPAVKDEILFTKLSHCYC